MYEFKPRTVKATATSLDLTWPTLNDSGVGTAFQIIYRDGTPIGKVSGSEFHYMDQGLTPSTTYKYKIIPTDFYGSTGATLSFEASTKSETAPAATVPPDDVAATASNATVGGRVAAPAYCGEAECNGCDYDCCEEDCEPYDPDPGPPPPVVTFNAGTYLQYRPVRTSGPLSLVNHSYIYETFSVTVTANYTTTRSGYTQIIEVLPQYEPPVGPPTLWGNMVNHVFPNGIGDDRDNPLTDGRTGGVEESGTANPATAVPVFMRFQVANGAFSSIFGWNTPTAIRYLPTPLPLGGGLFTPNISGENSNWFAWWIIAYSEGTIPNLMSAMIEYGIPPAAPGFPLFPGPRALGRWKGLTIN